MENTSKDFLYVDNHKVADHLAQLIGFLKSSSSVVKTTHEEETAIDRSGKQATTEKPGKKETVKTGTEKMVEELSHHLKGFSESSNYVYSHTYTIELLSLLEENDILKKPQDGLKPGDWVLIKTHLSLFDTEMVFSPMSLLIKLWPVFQQVNQKIKNNLEKATMVMDVLQQSLPVQIHFSAKSTDMPHYLFQGVLDEKGLIENPRSLILRHGTTLGGQWTILGIVDNLPDNDGLTPIVSELLCFKEKIDKINNRDAPY